ncbi:MAG: efflux RND transporter periplasmic adaptor subunit [Bacteroidales bacterium]
MMKNGFYTLVISLFIYGCAGKVENDSQNNTVYVRAVTAEEQTVQFPVRSAGRLAAKSEQRLSFRTGGIISRINVRGGQEVTKGQLLAELNLQEIQAQVDMARESFIKAERDLSRIQNLYNDSVATLASLQDAQTAMAVAGSNLKIGQFNLQFSGIKAPENGKILMVLMEENEIVAPGHPVVLFGSTHQQWVIKINVSDKDMVLINHGDSAFISLDPFPAIEFPAVVTEIAGMADPFTGTYELELTLMGDHGRRLASGMIARASIIPQRKEQLILLPADAIFGIVENKGSIYTIRDTVAEKREIYIERIEGSSAYVKGNIQAGENVVIVGMSFINNDSRVVIKENSEFGNDNN